MEMAQVVYCLSRGGQMEHPHMIQVRIPAEQGGSLTLREVKKRLIVMRGRGMADAFCWSFKRSYKNNYIWQDLSSDDDVITPVLTGEYILKGSEIYDACQIKRVPFEVKREQGSTQAPAPAPSSAAGSNRRGERLIAASPSPSLAEYQIHDSALFNAKSPRSMLLVNDLTKVGSSNKPVTNSLHRQLMDGLSSAALDHAVTKDSTGAQAAVNPKVFHRQRGPVTTEKSVTVATQTDEHDNGTQPDDLPPLKSRTIPRIATSAQHAIDPAKGAPPTPEPSRAAVVPPTPAASSLAVAPSDRKTLAKICLRRVGGKDDEPAVSSARLKSGHSFRQLLCGVVDVRSPANGFSPEHQVSTPHIGSAGWLWRSKSKTSSERDKPERAGRDNIKSAHNSLPALRINRTEQAAAATPAAIDVKAPPVNEPTSPQDLVLRRPRSCSSPAMSSSSTGVCTSPTGSYSSSAVDSGPCESSNNSEASDSHNVSAAEVNCSTPRVSFSSRHSFSGFEGDYLQLENLSKDLKDGGTGKPLPPGFHKGMNDTKLRVRTSAKDGVKEAASPRVTNVSRAVAKHLLSNSTGVRYVSEKASPRSTLEWWNDTSSPRAGPMARGERYTPGRSSVDSLRSSSDWHRSSVDWSRNSLDGNTLQHLAEAMLPPPEFRQHVEDCLQCGRTFKPESVKAHMRGCHVHRAKALPTNSKTAVVR